MLSYEVIYVFVTVIFVFKLWLMRSNLHTVPKMTFRKWLNSEFSRIEQSVQPYSGSFATLSYIK